MWDNETELVYTIRPPYSVPPKMDDIIVVYNPRREKRRMVVAATFPAARGSRLAALVKVQRVDSF
jgi:hypothetical protein